MVNPRLQYIDADTSRWILQKCNERLRDTLEHPSAGNTLRQCQYSDLQDEYLAQGLHQYAVGCPIEEVRVSFGKSSEYAVMVYELRGTEDPFPAYTATFDASKEPGDPAALIEFKPLFEEGEKDYSLTNSRGAMRAVCTALCAGENEFARELAAMIWDPPDASYLSNRSVICTPNDQRLAYAIREFLAGNRQEALTLASKVRALPGKRLFQEALMLRMIIEGNKNAFLDALDDLLLDHDKAARHKYNRSDSKFFICINGQGLCELAVQDGLLDYADLPQENPYLPIDLLKLASADQPNDN